MNKILCFALLIAAITAARLKVDPTMTPTDKKDPIIEPKPMEPIKKPDDMPDKAPMDDKVIKTNKDDKKPIKMDDPMKDTNMPVKTDAHCRIEEKKPDKAMDTPKTDDSMVKKPEDPLKKDMEPSKEEKDHDKDPIIKHQNGDLPISIEIEGEKDHIMARDLLRAPRMPHMTNETANETANDTAPPEEKYFIEISSNKTLMDGLGYHFYKFSTDKKEESTCYGPCTTRWHPVLADSDISDNLKAPLTKADFSILKRKDGKMQLCFHGIPLYYFEEDSIPKDPPKGAELDEYGGDFSIVKDNDKN